MGKIALEQKLTRRIVSPESLDQIRESGTTCYSIPFVATLCKTHSFPVTWSLSKETWRRLRKLPNQTSLAGQNFLPKHETLHNYQVFHLIAWRVMFFGFQLMTPWLMQELMFYCQDCHFCLQKKEGQERHMLQSDVFPKLGPRDSVLVAEACHLAKPHGWSQCTLERWWWGWGGEEWHLSQLSSLQFTFRINIKIIVMFTICFDYPYPYQCCCHHHGEYSPISPGFVMPQLMSSLQRSMRWSPQDFATLETFSAANHVPGRPVLTIIKARP